LFALQTEQMIHPEDDSDSVWETNHSNKCKKKKVLACYIGINIQTKKLLSTHMVEFNDIKKVSIYKNIILEHIMHSIGCICKNNTKKKEFIIVPDNKFLIKVKKITNNSVELEQWCCHYDTIMQLTPISVRKVVIYL
jgi:hypothetical protein